MESPDQDQERSWVELAIRGDREAARLLLANHERVLYGYLHSALGRRDEIDDVMQEVLLRALENLSRFRGQGRFRSWLFQIARHQVIDRYRSRASSPRLKPSLTEDVADPNRSCEAHLIQAEQSERLALAIAKLPEVEREVVWMRLKSELSFREIAEITGAPLNTVLGRMHNAKERLRRWLAPTEVA